VSEEFDIGPLTWVKDEIDKSLDTVLENLKRLNDNISDKSPLRLAQTHAYQASGALDMVGLNGCKFFCSELEKCLSKLEKNEIELTLELVSQLIHAVETLKQYIDSLMMSARDIPLRLYDALSPITLVQGHELEKSELFFPDTSVATPKDLPVEELSEAEYAKFISNQRLTYQKAFLNWLQSKSNEPLSNMAQAVRNVCLVQTRSALKGMWWAVSAFADGLKDPAVAELAGTKRLCRKIDQELKLLQEGTAKANPQMFKDILYYVAISQVESDAIDRVKATFGLSKYVESAADQFTTGIVDQDEIGVAKQLSSIIGVVSDIWNEVSNKIDYSLNERKKISTISADSVLITKCADKLSENQALTQSLSQVVVVDLYSALTQAVSLLRDSGGVTSHPVLIEIAAGIHMLESSLSDYSELDKERVQKILSEIQRLELIASGAEYDQLALDRTSELDAETVKAVVVHVQDSLKVVEQALDGFFRNPEDKAALNLTAKPLKEVSSIFQMLNMEVPANIAKISQDFIDHFQSMQFTSNQGEFELLAESLSMLGIYAEGMPKVRPEYEKAMQSALERMQVVFSNLDTTNDDKVELQESLKVKTEVVTGTANAESSTSDKAFDDELLDIYLTETEEVLGQIAENLQLLKAAPSHEALVEVRRGFHTLKGSGRTVGLAALGEVAGKVETFLNDLLEKKANLTSHQIDEIEQVSAAFAGWADELREHHQVVFDLDKWVERIEAWNKVAEKKPSDKKSEDNFVLIAGKRKLSKQLYNIFLNESMLNITALEQDLVKMNENAGQTSPSDKAKHAIHTLSSNALAAGFENMGRLGRTVEAWLDEVGSNWSLAQHKLFSRVVKAIARMWQAVSELKEPRAETALIKAVQKVTPSFSDAAKPDIQIQNVEPPKGLKADHVVEAEQVVKHVAKPEQVVTPLEKVVAVVDSGDAEVDEEILALFSEEVDELLPLIGNELRAWRANSAATEHADELQRALHTLKGSARMAGKNNLADIVHNMEERIVQALKRGVNERDFERLFYELDSINVYFEEGVLPEVIDYVQAEEVESATTDTQQNPIKTTVTEFTEEDEKQTLLRASKRKAQFLRMRADVLDRLINEAGEISIIRSRIDKEVVGFKTTSHDLTDSVSRLRNYLRELEIEADTQLQSRLTLLQEANEKFDPLEFDRFTRLQELTRMMAESVNDISTIQQGLIVNLGQAEAALQQQTRMNRELQQALMSVRMLPFSQLSDRMDRIVRQTARELDKLVEFTIEGGKTEVDRSVLDKIGAPLEHLLRNAVAHGLETQEVRKKSGKPETGKLHLKVSSQNDEIRIEVSDDGGGINLKKVKEIAIKNNIINTNAEINDQGLMSVIFEPGFSTSTEVSQISGRGVGLDVVRNEVTALGGRIDVDSKANQGTSFTIYLPVTLTVAQVLLVRSGQTQYAISVAMIEQAQKVKHADLLKAYDVGGIDWAGNHYPLHHISKLLNEKPDQHEHAYASILLLRSGNYRIALHVDDMLGNQEVVVKPIGEALARVPGIMGATVTGEGDVMFILNPLLLANREVLAAGSVQVEATNIEDATETVAEQKYSALVVDDSLTMRKVLSRLLEREGYEVLVAKDGMDAMQLLQQTVPDVILTDIEMPRMDGFGLARNIRDDARTANTPLIMISSRTADKHQNMAKDIGVDAFFGKPVHDDELLAKVGELLANKNTMH
jgi:chemosensory pili system protein ChpA (sensor histidine kinase/response regulator)